MFINALTIGEIFSIGGLTALIGMGITFLLLGMLILALILMDKLPKLYLPKKKQDIPSKNDSLLNKDTFSNEDEETIAAIMTAISMVMSTDYTTKANFVVKSIKKINN